MNRSNPPLATTFVLYIIILALPFLMFHWMAPFLSDWTIGNDYPRFSIQHQMELMFSLKMGSFPLYVPGFAGGQSASALTLGQIFHPISHISEILPGYWTGKALEWNTLLHLLFLGWAQLVLFVFLRKLRLGMLIAFALSTLTVYNSQTLVNFHTGASLEAWTGHLFLCAAIGLYCLRPTKWLGPLSIIGSTYWLVCSGRPQMMYYGLLGAGLITLIVPYFLAQMLPDREVNARNVLSFWVRVALCCVIGISLSSAYVLPFYFDFLVTNAERVGRGYAWANTYQDSLIGTLNNFFQPLRSFGRFGGSSLFLAAALIPILRLFRVKIPRVIWVIWGLLLIAFLHMQGSRTPVHYLVWKYMPFASSIRDAGRISFIMPILFMLALTWVVQAKAICFRFVGREIQMSPATILALLAPFLIILYWAVEDSITINTGTLWPVSIRQIPSWVLHFVLLSGAASLVALAAHASLPKAKSASGVLLCLLTCAQIMAVLHYGTWVERKKDTPTFAQMLADKRQSLGYHADLPGLGLASKVVLRQVERSFLEPFLGKVYRRYLVAGDNDEDYALIEQGRAPDQVVVEGYIPRQHVNPEGQTLKNALDHLKLVYSSFNRLVFDVWASQPGFFGLAYPYTGRWRATVNGAKVKVYRANGASQAVQIPAGQSQVEFLYWSPAAFWGMIISCTTFTLLGLFISFYALNRRLKGIVGLLVLLLGIGGFLLWYQSLYAGDNIGAIYTWTESAPRPVPNIAYGKRTEMSSYLYAHRYPYIHSSSRAVDGDRSPGSGFITELQPEPWWMVDLHRPKSIGSIVVYGCPWSDPTFNTQKLMVALSSDKEKWVGKTVPMRNFPLHLMFNRPRRARYVMLKATGSCHLALDEVEIYPPH